MWELGYIAGMGICYLVMKMKYMRKGKDKKPDTTNLK